ncbi:hypothetical protein EYC80_005674 [Monilinia laxa]|uniref:Uncharacterized protein n=1 Tax=Monilinia laxa TaxID=61186 RepID=A0A5N6KEM0_MONLA|nr:hypothetical protein EYC80_005674 [Monilinia laxa]
MYYNKITAPKKRAHFPHVDPAKQNTRCMYRVPKVPKVNGLSTGKTLGSPSWSRVCRVSGEGGSRFVMTGIWDSVGFVWVE